MGLFDFLGWGKKDPAGDSASSETETVRRIVAKLDNLEPERARFVAAFAYVLSRVAGADLQRRTVTRSGHRGSECGVLRLSGKGADG